MIEQLPPGTMPVLISSVMPSDPTENMAVSLALAALAFLITVIIGGPIVDWLRYKNIGKQVREDAPESHGLTKTGTPTMGGIMIAISVLLVTFVFNLAGRGSMLLPVGILLAAGILGFLDDRLSLVGRSQEGMRARKKLLAQIGFSSVAAIILYSESFGLGLHNMYVPFVGKYDIGLFYIPIAALTIVALSNAVNLTDGLDGLAGGLAAIAFVCYGIIAYQQGQTGVVTFSFTMVGSLMGFLWFNAHPAHVFMGDTGSLALGATLAVVAFMTGQWLLLPIVAAVFIAETVSVILQVAYFKRTGGKRLFRMTPLHHHFEKVGWSEPQIQMRFWIIGMMFGLLGVAMALL